MREEFKITEAEKNILCLLRTRKPYEVITLRMDKNGDPDFWRIRIEQDLLVTSLGIEEIAPKRSL